VLLIGLSLALLGSLACALSTNLWALSIGRTVQGAGSAAGLVIGRSMVQDLFQGAERTRVMAYIGMALGLCPPIASIIGGQIHVHFGWQGNFVLIAVLAAVLIRATWRGLPVLAQTSTHDVHWLDHMLSAYKRLVRERDFLLYVVILAMTTSTFYIFLAGAPIVLSAYGVGPEGVGWYIMCVPITYIAGNFMTSHLIHRVGEPRMMVWGQVAALSGLCLLLLLGVLGVNSPWAFTAPLMLLGLGHGFLNPPALAGTVGVIPALAGSAAAVAGLMQQLVGAVGGALVGWVSHQGSVNLGLLMLGFTVCGLMGQLALHRGIGRRR
jgi:DHA1 family bicyclomycin/chloramphenicol resistance-like MFS transporter